MNETLMHFGIKGMKWGVRRFQNEDGSLTPAGKERYDENDDSENRERKTSDLSDTELKERIGRLEMEKKYETLLAEQKDRNTGKAKKMLGKALESLGEKALGVGVDKLIGVLRDKMNKSEKFDPREYLDTDVFDMDENTMNHMVKYFQNAQTISGVKENFKNKGVPKVKKSESNSKSATTTPNPVSNDNKQSESKTSWWRKQKSEKKLSEKEIAKRRKRIDEQNYKWIG